MPWKLALLFFLVVQALARPSENDNYMHRHVSKRDIKNYNPDEENASYWINQAQLTLNEQLNKQPIYGTARNVIMFVGDGMSIPTLAATRVYLGRGTGASSGEEVKLSFERFPYTGLSKTYCVDRQVADSACSATAYLCGVKANLKTLGVSASVPYGDCEAMQNPAYHVDSIARWSQKRGKRTGIVTTTRVTHASPAGTFAHTSNRDWESDTNVLEAGFDPIKCPDIATQLIHGETGRNFNVILGGGRSQFLPKTAVDEQGYNGNRSDERNLISEWRKQRKEAEFEYVWNRTGLLGVSDNVDYLLGLFNKNHISYNLERDPLQEPSLAEMTEAAIRLLSKGGQGYFLFVEGGRIDHAHHETKAQKALNETVEFHKAIQAAVDLTDTHDTLIVVTSDHAHTMSVSGYPARGNDILGIAEMGEDKLPYSTLSYANGPGYKPGECGHRHDISNDNMLDLNYQFPSLLPLESETHGGDDVGIFALGPWAHLFTGVLEENVIPHLMAYASCVGDGVTVCDEIRRT